MKTLFSAAMISIVMIAPAHAVKRAKPAVVAKRGTPAEAVAMTKKAVAYIQKHGQEKACADFSNPANKEFHDRDLYIFVYDTNGVVRGHGTNPGMIGMTLLMMRDSDGKYMIKEFIAKTGSPPGYGWVEYKWNNPLSNTIDLKSAYVEKIGNLIVGSGVYK